MTRMQEIEARLAAIANEIESRGAELTAEQLLSLIHISEPTRRS